MISKSVNNIQTFKALSRIETCDNNVESNIINSVLWLFVQYLIKSLIWPVTTVKDFINKINSNNTT